MVAQFLAGASPELKWADTSRRGYLTVELTPETAAGEWVFMNGVAERGLDTGPSRTMTVARGRRRFAA